MLARIAEFEAGNVAASQLLESTIAGHEEVTGLMQCELDAAMAAKATAEAQREADAQAIRKLSHELKELRARTVPNPNAQGHYAQHQASATNQQSAPQSSATVSVRGHGGGHAGGSATVTVASLDELLGAAHAKAVAKSLGDEGAVLADGGKPAGAAAGATGKPRAASKGPDSFMV